MWFQNRRAKFRRNERSSAINRGSSASREMEVTLPLRPLRINPTSTGHENSPSNESLQSTSSSQYPSYTDYWRSHPQHYVQTTSPSCQGFGMPSYHHQSELHHHTNLDNSSALRLRPHPYGYSAMHASM